MRVLVTGAFGLVGRQTLRELLSFGHEVRAFDLGTPANRNQAKKIPALRDIVWGSLTDLEALTEVCEDIDAVIHLGAIIPPLADKQPLAAYYVNVAGTGLLVRTLQTMENPPVLVFTSSVSVYGDRVSDPYIRLGDEVRPGVRDYYAQQKVMAEGIVRDSGLNWTIPRLSYVVSPEKLKLDPIMFEMPLDTSLEIVHVNDVAWALRRAAEYLNAERHVPAGERNVTHATFHIAGGIDCRITYREYLRDMFRLFGLGKNRFEESMWNTKDFHCGFMDTELSQKLFRFQATTLDDYYRQVAKVYAFKALFISMIRPLAWLWLKNNAKALGHEGNRGQLARLAVLMKRTMAGLGSRGTAALN